MKIRMQAAALAASITLGLAGSAGAQDSGTQNYDPEAYFGGKTIRFIVSWSAGGNGDAYIRIFAPYFSKHMPGNPTVVVENMPGGGHNIATNYMYNEAEPTGYVIGTYGSARAVASAKGDEGVNFASPSQ